MRGVIGDVSWSTPGQSSADSLPLGNGDIAANVWTEPTGDIRFYVAKNDAWDHLGRLIKIGRLRLRITPSLTAGGKFEQRLDLADAAVVVTNGVTTVRLWIDAHWPRLVIEVSSAAPCRVEVSLDPWRSAPREIGPKEAHTACGLEGGPVKLMALPDHVVPAERDAVIWYQRNESSVWPLTLDQQGLGEFKAKSADPLLHRTFGGCLAAPGFTKSSDTILTSATSVTSALLTLTVHAAQTDSVATWLAQIRAAAAASSAPRPAELWHDHQQWWREFWDRSYIRPASRAPDWNQAATVAEQSAWQRYLVGCCGRGLYPVKFNGGLFTADWALPDEAFDADYRRWGGGYWFQNTRLIYWALLANGDYELTRPLFRMYRDMLPLAEHRTQAWFGHGGAFFPETLYFWGTHLPGNYGWDRTGKASRDIENQYIRRYWVGGLELIALMLETHAHTGDAALLENELLPIARAVLAFYAAHYANDSSGRLHLAPAQALETWWTAENPLPEIAGLHYLLPRLLALPGAALRAGDADAWRSLAARLPSVPSGTVDGRKILLAAEKHEPVPNNTENAELYAVFPFKLHGLGRPELDVAQWTFQRRMFPDTGGWRQDAVQAALLGLTEPAAFYVSKNFNNNSPFRFKGFWGPNFDWVPDYDNGSVAQLALQTMLVQSVGEKIYLFPAWPTERWNVTFKLHTTGQTVLEGELKDGELVRLIVTPESRRKDVVVLLGRDKSNL